MHLQRLEHLGDHLHGRRLKLGALLSLWRARHYWLPDDRVHSSSSDSDAPILTEPDAQLWSLILQHATPIPPRTLVVGLRTHAEFHGISIEQLIDQKAAFVAGTRAATRFSVLRECAPGLQGYTPGLLLSITATGAPPERCVAVLGQRFRTVQQSGDSVLAAEPRGTARDALGILAAAATRDRSNAALSRLWSIASALGVDEAFVALLENESRARLGQFFAAELQAAAAELDVDSDARLWAFTEGQATAGAWRNTLALPTSRLSNLLETQRALELMQGGANPQDHYEELARAAALCASVETLTSLLPSLPPGRALKALCSSVLRHRPGLLALLAENASVKAEAAFMALSLDARIFSLEPPIDLSDEWIEVQRLVRQQLLSTPTTDWASLAALGIHDEEVAEQSRRALRNSQRSPDLSLQDRMASWTVALGTGAASAITASVVNHLNSPTQHATPALVFALRLASLADATTAVELASATVDAYARDCTLDARQVRGHSLGTHGELLAGLRRLLGDGAAGEKLWRKWLRPFDAVAHLSAAHREQQEGTLGSVQFDAPEIIRAHAETLAAEGDAMQGSTDEILDPILELYFADRESDLHVSAFSWAGVSGFGGVQRAPLQESVLVRMGRLISRSTHRDETIKKVLAGRNVEAHVLARLVLGLGSGSSVQPVLAKLRELIGHTLDDENGVAVGHALDLANLLHLVGLPREAERCARRALEISATFVKVDQSFSEIARILLAAALAQQGDWVEVTKLHKKLHDQTRSIELDFLTAVAFANLNRPDEARDFVGRVLARAPEHPGAILLLCWHQCERKNWSEALQTAKKAKGLIEEGSVEWINLIRLEADAREGIGDRPQAELLRRLTPQGPEATALPVRTVEIGQSPDPHPAPDPVRVPHSEPPVEVAIITALTEEYQAVLSRLSNVRDPSSSSAFPNTWQWKLGEVKGSRRNVRVVVACCGRSGNPTAGFAALRSIDRFSPRFVLFSGIAGGVRKKGVRLGDVIFSESIWYWEYGKVERGAFKPRQRDTFSADGTLVTSGKLFHIQGKIWGSFGKEAPTHKHEPAFKSGTIASGEKVVDDLEFAPVKAAMESNPDIHAVEMEAAGACFAIKQAHAEGRAVGFAMVRGISDLPRSERLLDRVLALLGSPPPSQSNQRDAWKVYASEVAGHFVVSWIASDAWPTL